MWLEFLKDIPENNHFENIKNNIFENTFSYEIKSWDNLYEISKKYWIEVNDLIILNEFLWTNFKKNNSWKIILSIWQEIYIPKDLEEYKNNLNIIREIHKSLQINQEFTQTWLDKLYVDVDLFPKYVQTVWLSKILEWFLYSQKENLDPRFPRIVDHSRETSVSCANLIRTMMAQSVNAGDLNKDEKKFFRKQNLHAWILPNELKKIWFNQKFEELMSYFDTDLIWAIDPRKPDKIDYYNKTIIQLNEYLKNSWIPWTLIPLYFKYSLSKNIVREYNLTQKEKHYNTHQTMFAWNINLEVKPFEVPDLSTWEPKILSTKKEDLIKQIIDLELSLEHSKNNLEFSKTNLVSFLDNIQISNHLQNAISRTVDLDKEKAKFLQDNLSQIWSVDELRSFIKNNKLSKREQTTDDLNYLLALQKIENKCISDIKNIKDLIQKWENIDLKLWRKLSSFEEIIDLIEKYNNNIIKINNIPNQIIKTQNDLDNLEKNPPNITLIDFIANFIQYRLDYKSSYSLNTRKQIIDWISLYPELLYIKVDWLKIDIKSEIEKYKNKLPSIFLTQLSKVEISGPMMIDWEHQFHHDEDRAKKMNSRTRFLFEFIIPQSYLPSEILEPSEKSSFYKKDFWKITDDIKVKWVYDLRSWERLEEVLKDKISKFENIAINDPKINYYYSLQIKALQVYWYLQNEWKINPWALKTNRVIPYFDVEKIPLVFKDYQKEKEKFAIETSQNLLEMKDFVSIDLYYWDIENRIFNRLLNILSSSNLDKYPHIKKINSLNFIQQNILTEYILSINETELNIKPWKKIIISLSKIDEKIKEISENNYWLEKPKNLKKIDKEAISLLWTNWINEVLISNILVRETYNDNFFWVSDFKRQIENTSFAPKSLWDLQLRIWFLNHWFNEWLNKKTLNKIFNIIESEDFQKIFNNFWNKEKNIIKTDLLELNKIKEYLSKEKLEKSDFEEITKILSKLIRIDDWSWSNIAWKIISFSFLDSKLNNHFEKITWILQKTQEDIWFYQNDDEKMENISRVVALINNKWEWKALKVLFETFLIRLLKDWFKIDLQTSFKKATFSEKFLVWAFEPKLLLREHIEYNDQILISNIWNYISQVNQSKDWEYSLEEREIIKILEKFYLEKLNKNITINDIYNLINNEIIKSYLSSKNLSTSIIPEEQEFKWTQFTIWLFDYVNKMF